MKKDDNRLICSDSKKASIKASLLATASKRQNQVFKTYECKIVEKRLNKRQREELQMLFVEGKWFYNHVLSLHKSGTKLNKINSTTIKQVERFDKNGNRITTKLEFIGSQQKQAIVTRMSQNERAIITLVRNGFKKHGDLQFKSELTCIPLKQYGISYKFKSFNKVKVQGIHGDILVKTGNQLQNVDELANANLVKKPDGYYLKVTCFINKENFREHEKNGKEIGLDFGIKTSITTSEGEKLDVSVGESERLKRLQRKMSRQIKGSNNRYRTIGLIQREYQKLSQRKRDKANKIISKLKKYETIVMQDEQIANWHKSGFGKQVQYSCMGLVKAKLKALPQTIVLDKWIPTTKWCPKCGTIKKCVQLSDRKYRCRCGHFDDRDVHSARNMLVIKDLVFSKNNFVPAEHREITLAEFKTSVFNEFLVDDKSERRSEKLPGLQPG